MTESYLDLLKHLAPTEPTVQLEATARELETLTTIFAEVVCRLPDANAQRALASQLGTATLARLANGRLLPPYRKLTPEELEWARGLDTEEEILAGIREIRETGGLELKDFIHELFDVAPPDA